MAKGRSQCQPSLKENSQKSLDGASGVLSLGDDVATHPPKTVNLSLITLQGILLCNKITVL